MRKSFSPNPHFRRMAGTSSVASMGSTESRAGACAPAVDPGRLKLNPSSQSTSAHPPASAVEPIRVAIVVASKAERLGWSIVIDSQEDMDIASQFSSFDSALVFFRDHSVDVALVDEIFLTPGAWEDIARLSRSSLPRLLILARHPAETPFEQPLSGVHSRHLLKGLPAADLLAAIREAVASPALRAE